MPYLEIEQLTKNYQGEAIFEAVDLSVDEGEFVSLLGPSGVGKTTLFNILSGLELPDEGRIRLEGEDITGKTGRFSYMQQKDLLLPFYTLIDNLALPLRLRGESKAQAYEKVRQHLAEFRLVGAQDKYPAQLSGGMKQRAALLRAYLFSQRLMLLDEPFSALDSITKRSMHDWYRAVAEKNRTTTFFITHDIDEALILSDKIYVMTGKPGKVAPPIVLEKPSDFELSASYAKIKKDLLARIQAAMQ